MLKPIDFLNKMILVGITVEQPDGTKDYIQTHGTVERVEGNCLFLKRKDDVEFCLGFSIEAFSIAKPGIYREKSTGIEIENPDYICRWVATNHTKRTNEQILKEGFKGYTKQ